MREEDIPKVEKITEEIIHLIFDTQENLCRHFIRFQEHYESPEFRGKIFTLGQYRQWYAKRNGGFTYYRDWIGMNIPSYVLDPFIKGLFDPLTAEEQTIVNMFRCREGKYYLIGTFEDDKEQDTTIRHEVCHGLFYTDDKYCKKVTELIEQNWNELKELREWLLRQGYSKDVLLDECHAYVSEAKEKQWSYGEFPASLNKKLQNLLKRRVKDYSL
jgi:hypothetical protein